MFSVTIQDVMDNLEIIERDKIEKYLIYINSDILNGNIA